jgi:hypothetical protein
MLNPLPLGTPVKIRITYGEKTIDAMGRVIYSQSNMGMGVSFDEMEPDHEALLEKWFEEAKGN